MQTVERRKRGFVTNLLLEVDRFSDGIRLRLVVAAAVLQVFLAPLWDQYLRGGNPNHKASSTEPVTFIATLVFLTLGIALLGGRLLALSMDDDDGDAERASRPSLREMFDIGVDHLRSLMRLNAQFLARLGAGLIVTMLAGRGALGLLRWLAWQAMKFFDPNVTADSIFAWPRHLLELLYHAEIRLQQGVAVFALPVAVAAAWAFLRKTQRPTVLHQPQALANIDPLLVRGDASDYGRIGELFGGEIETLLKALAEWKPRTRRFSSEHRCRDDIARFLRGKNYQVDTERWIEGNGKRGRVDLMVEDRIPIELKYELQGTAEADRADGQIRRYANCWGAVGPILLFLARTERESAEYLGNVSQRWNAGLDGTKAPILILADSQTN